MPYSFFTEGGEMLGGTPVSLKLEVEPEPVNQVIQLDLADEVEVEEEVLVEGEDMIDEEDDFFSEL